jgi:hypothetical protein
MVDQHAIEVVLESYLKVLGLEARPIKWAKDGNTAQALVTRGELESLKDLDSVFGESIERFDDGSWWRARNEAKASGHGRQLDVARAAVCWHAVLLSIPWSKYHQRLTGERGRSTNPEGVWEAGGDALEYAARAYAEDAWSREEAGRPSRAESWLPFINAYEVGLWIFWITKSEVIALPRPAMKLSGEQLHSADGPALSWPDGEEEHFFLNDVHVPKELVETPANELDPRLMLRERNASVRREIVRKIGIERICQALEAECIDTQGDYELLLLDLQDGRRRPFLKMKNPSVGVYHIEGVAPECRNVREALVWRNQSDVPPSVLT